MYPAEGKGFFRGLHLLNAGLTARNFSTREWQFFLGDEPYRKTCQNRPLHASFLEMVWGQVKAGDAEGAIAKLHLALQAEGVSNTVVQKEARRLAALGMVAEGKELAQAGKVEQAVIAFQRARSLDPNLELDAEKEAWRLAAPWMVEKGMELAKQGAIKEAMAAFATAQTSDPDVEIAAQSWNYLCWVGSLQGFARDAMAACEQAVALEPGDGGIHDSRGVARALTGNYPGAIEDFQQYLEWIEQKDQPKGIIQQRRDWIRMLQENQNPFNKDLLKRLLDQ